jgi:hypothetical protein
MKNVFWATPIFDRLYITLQLNCIEVGILPALQYVGNVP